MAQRCEVCGKGPVSGNNVSHSKVRTKRRFLPNLQTTTLYRNGKPLRATVCTRCIRTSAKAAR